MRRQLLGLAENDPRITGAAVTGSAADGQEDRWSDIDLFFGVADNIDFDCANVFLTRCRKAFYWTLVQYSQEHRRRGLRVECRGKSPSYLHTLST